jgi:hypothetical protein
LREQLGNRALRLPHRRAGEGMRLDLQQPKLPTLEGLRRSMRESPRQRCLNDGKKLRRIKRKA